MSKKTKIFVTLFVVVVLFGVAYQYIYQDHRDISSEDVSYELKVDDLQSNYDLSSEEANQRFLDKTIMISGKITAVDKNIKSIMLDEKVNCSFRSDIDVSLNDMVSVKGRFIGYDELLDEFKVDECSIVKNMK